MSKKNDKLTFVLGADTDEAVKAMRNVDHALKKTEDAVVDTQEAFENIGESAEDAAKTADRAFRQMKVRRDKNLEGEIESIEKRRDTALKAEDLTAGERIRIEAAANRRIATLRRQLDAENMSESNRALDQMGIRRKAQIEQEIADVRERERLALSSTNLTAHERLQVERQTAEQIKRLNKELAETTASDFQVRMQSAAQSLQGIGQGLTSAGMSITRRVSAPVGVGLGFGIRSAAALESKMQGVRGIYGDSLSDEEFNELENIAREIGRTTSFSANEAAGAIEMLAANGLEARQILDGALRASIAASLATGGDLSLSADLMTDIGAQFGLAAKELPAIANSITGLRQASKFDAQGIREAVGQGGSRASSMGMSVEDFMTSIASVDFAFKGGSEAGTSFRAFLQRLASPSKEGGEAMAEAGLDVFEDGNLVSPEEIAARLQKSVAEMTTQELNDFMTTVFGTYASGVGIALSQIGAEGVAEKRLKIQGASAERTAEIREEGFSGSFRELSSANEALGIALAKSGLLETLTKLVKTLTSFVSALGESNPVFLKFLAWAGVALVILGPFLMFLGQVAIGLALLAKALAMAGGAAAGFKLMFAGIAGLFGLIKAGVASLFGLAGIFKVGAAAAVGFAAIIGKIAAGVAAFVVGILGAPALVIGLFAVALGLLGVIIWDARESIVEALMGAWQYVADGAVSIFTGIYDFFANLFKSLVDLLPTWDGVKERWKNSTIGSAIASLPGFATGVVDLQGPGTGTSDSILARLSKGESVITAKATSFWGNDVMNAINSMDIASLMMPAPMPVPVGVGSGGGMSSVHLHFGSDEYNLYGDDETVRRLERDQNLKSFSPTRPSKAFR